MSGKIYRNIKEQAPTEAVEIATATAFIKEHTRSTFDETLEVHVNLNVDPAKSDQMVRGSVKLPSGAPKQKRIGVITADAKQQQAATEAGATLVGGEELIDQIAKEEKIDVDILVATPDLMPKLAQVARILGPLGLMPNPKTDTVSPEPAATVAELAGGKVSFKMDQSGNIHEAIAKASWDADKISANIEALINAVQAARPDTAKGQLINSITLTSTMGPGIRLAVS